MGHGVDGLNNVAGKVARMAGSEAHAADAADFADRGEQFSEGHLAARVAIGIDVLAEELNFREARIRHAAGFGQDGVRGAGTLLAAGVRAAQ